MLPQTSKHPLRFGSLVTGISVAASISMMASCSVEPEQPNIIFIMTDDHTERAISAFGDSPIETPNIDRIADEGMLFSNSFVTNSICAPSRAVMLTGKYSHVNGKRDNQDEFDGSQPTYPQILHDSGYQTAMIGKWHLESEPTGFDTYSILSDSGGQGVYYNPNFNENGHIVNEQGYATDIITDMAIDFLDEATQSDEPFLMLMHHKAPHRNWMPSPEYVGRFEDVTFPIPDTFYDDYDTRELAAQADMRVEDMYLSQDMKLQAEYYGVETGTGGLAGYASMVGAVWEHEYENMTEEQRAAWDAVYQPINEEYARMNLSGNELAEWKYQRYMRDYMATVLSVDDSIGEILDYLDEHDLADNTIVVYTSDQGFYLGEHGWFDKRWMYEESFRMPLLIRYPDMIKPGSVADEFVMNLDFAPTLLDLAGFDVPEDIQGESMREILQGKTPKDWRQSMYYHYYEYPSGWHNVQRHFGVRNDRYKLINFYNARHWELFDLQEDPDELHNVYDDPAYSDVVADMTEELNRLRSFYGDNEY